MNAGQEKPGSKRISGASTDRGAGSEILSDAPTEAMASTLSEAPSDEHKPHEEAGTGPPAGMSAASGVGDQEPSTANPEPESGSWKDRIGFLATLLGIAVAILAIVGALLEMPKKVEEARQAVVDPEGVALRALEGEIRDGVTNQPLRGVEVVLPRHGMRQTTDELGRYRFELELPQHARVTLRASHDGYRTLELDPMVGGYDTYALPRLE